ncbi:MAG TPA: site-specific integrase [Gammaproteobacteria bacterium]|nr:site-specific integrase [Gammaproteobacteria bacterium]
MATIQKRIRKDGKASYRVLIRRQDRKAITATFPTRRAAEKFAREVEGNIHKYASVIGGEASRHTLAELIDRFMEDYQGKDTSMPTRAAWWRDHYGDRILSQFTSDVVQEGLERLRREPRKQGGRRITETSRKRSPATINRYLSALSTVFAHACKHGWMGLRENPCRGVGRGKETHRFGRYLTDDERAALLEACEASKWPGLPVMVRLALATGARRGELLGLTWKDVDLKRGIIHLRATKNGEDRTVPLVADVRGRLEAWGKIRPLNSRLVFPHPSMPAKPIDIYPFWNEALEKAGIKNFRFHDLRHSCASYLAMSGASPLQIGAVLGHRTLAMVHRYSHLNTSDTGGLLEGALNGKL